MIKNGVNLSERKLRSILLVMDGKSVTEVAKEQGVSEGVVRGHLDIPDTIVQELGLDPRVYSTSGVRAMREHAKIVRPLIEKRLREVAGK